MDGIPVIVYEFSTNWEKNFVKQEVIFLLMSSNLALTEVELKSSQLIDSFFIKIPFPIWGEYIFELPSSLYF